MDLVKTYKGISVIALAHALIWFVNNVFDWVVYTSVIAYFGLINGFFIMIPLSIIFNLILLFTYNKIGEDIFGAEALKKSKDRLTHNKPSWLKSVIVSSEFLSLLFLSVYDPFLTLVFFRNKKPNQKGLSLHDWKIFLFSTLISNAWWSVVLFTGMSAIGWVFKYLSSF